MAQHGLKQLSQISLCQYSDFWWSVQSDHFPEVREFQGPIDRRRKEAGTEASVFQYVHAQLLSHVQLFVTPWTVGPWAPLSMKFSRQEYWSRLPFPSLGDLPDPGSEPVSPVLADRFFTT